MANRVAAIHEARELSERVQAVLMVGVFADSGEARAKALAFKTRLRVFLAEYEQPEPPAPEEDPEED